MTAAIQKLWDQGLFSDVKVVVNETENDSKKLAIKIMKLIEFIEKTDNEYPINFIKKPFNDKIEE